MEKESVIKRLRKKHNMTQEELGNILGVTKASVQKYENGSIVNLKADTLRKLCETFKVAPIYFLYPDEDFVNDIVFDVYGVHEHQLQSILKVYSELTQQIFAGANKLNEVGKLKVHEYILDLQLIEKYKKD